MATEGTYVVDLYGDWQREGSEAKDWIAEFQTWPKDFRAPFELKSITRRDKTETYIPIWSLSQTPRTEVVKSSGTFHVQLEVKAFTTKEALDKSKKKVVTWFKNHTCTPPTLTFT